MQDYSENKWNKFKLEEELCDNLVKNKFLNPTEIQHRMLYYQDYPVDIVGVSQTGSGKTLAYLLPMINNLFKQLKGNHTQAFAGEEIQIMEDHLDQEEDEQESIEDMDDQVDNSQEEDMDLEDVNENELNIEDDEEDEEEPNEDEDGCQEEEAPQEDEQEVEEEIKEIQEEVQEELEADLSNSTLPSYMQGLVLVPTRELAIQVYKVARQLKEGIFQKHIRIGLVIGGLSKEKQKRIIEQKPHILICTTGRLWDLIDQDKLIYLRSLAMIKFLILDEADRMIELGQFRELDKILSFIYKDAVTEQETQLQIREDIQQNTYNPHANSSLNNIPEELQGLVDSGVDFHNTVTDVDVFTRNEISMMKHAQTRRRTIVISATLGKSFWSSRMMNKLNRKKMRKALKKDKDTDFNPKIDEITRKLKFNFKLKIIDLTKEQQVMPSQLEIMRVKCPTEDKMLYLVHFCQVYHDQLIIIFTNSINSTKRVSSILQTMNIKSIALHSKQQQRQRIKKLEQFRDFKKQVLVATDVASRGLDIPRVGVVMHLHCPKDADSFLHRCGRTARIGKAGLSLIISDNSDSQRIMKYFKDIGGKEKIKLIEVPIKKLDDIRQHVSRANLLEKEKFQMDKSFKEKKWQKKTAEAAGLEYSDDEKMEDDEIRAYNDMQRKDMKIKERQHQFQLKDMVAQRNSVNAKKKGRSVILNSTDMLAAREQLEMLKKQKLRKDLENQVAEFTVNYLQKTGKGFSKGDKLGSTVNAKKQAKREKSKNIKKRKR